VAGATRQPSGLTAPRCGEKAVRLIVSILGFGRIAASEIAAPNLLAMTPV
jgi:hypothetical protein